ncbi:MAG: nucleoside-diphosphate sugar epimerase/dehydratase [Clostridia bacterium]|nr:nucleoside-diphosphate sugar epimerase/dehydratase [Clostridia bacterium]
MALKNKAFWQRKNSFVFLILDVLIGFIAFYGAYYLRFEGNIPALSYVGFSSLWLWYIVGKIGVFYFAGIYKRVWRFARVEDLLALVSSLLVTVLGLVSLSYFFSIAVPRSIFILTWLLDVFLSGGIRVIPKIYKERGLNFHHDPEARKVLVVGAGDAGVLVVKELLRQESPTQFPVGFLDDDPRKLKTKIMGLPVLGNRKDLVQVVKENEIAEVLITMPTAAGAVIKEIAEDCRRVKVPVRTLPRIYDIINGEITVDLIREVKLEDLLGREAVHLDTKIIRGSIQGKKVLVTGAGGSIGSELCRQICRFHPVELVLLGHDENPLFEIELELQAKFPTVIISTVIADIKDFPRMEAVFQEKKPEVVFHAAAHKHVPLMEENPGEAFKNNVLGTRNVAEAVDRTGVESFVFISTDKAVNPTSVMGATKRIAEMVIQNFNEISTTKFVAVRFGNVLGSRGSVVPIFQEQIRKGGPVTVTDPEMRRFFMTVAEAAQLVLQAGGMAEGGEIFILDMGEPVKIVDLARDLIRLSGLEPEEDIKIEFTGIRPGEKLYEEILTEAEGITATKHQRIFVAQKQDFNYEELERLYQKLHNKEYCRDRESIFQLLKNLEEKQVCATEKISVS